MAHNYLSNLKSTLDNCITELDEIYFMFCRNPESNFTKNRKLSFHGYIQFMLQMQSKSVSNEILDFFEHSISAPTKSDRGYESFNVFAHLIHKNMKCVIRLKDINSNGIVSAYDLPNSEFDTSIRITLTRRHTKKTLGNPNTSTILQPVTDFDFLNGSCSEYNIEFRIVRIFLNNGTYICIATNLFEEAFPLEEIKKLYRMRWTEETSFRKLKYTIGLVNWHSSK